MKKFFAKYRPMITKSLIVFAIVATITLTTYFILKALGFTSVENFQKLRGDLGDSIYFWLIVGLLQIIQVIFIPITNQIVTVPIAIVFNDQLWKVWATSWISIWLATLILYWIGRAGGAKLLGLIIDDEDKTEKIVQWLNKGWIFYPLGMLLPVPDDLVTILSGTAKMNFIFILITSLITRGIDTATSTFGFGLLSRYWWGWLVMVGAWVLFALVTYLFWKIIQNRDQKKMLESKEAIQEEQEN